MALLQSPAGPRTDDGTAGTSLLAESRELAGRLAWPTTAARDDERRWDTGLFTRLADTQHGRGLTGPLVPRALGGRGLSAADTCELLEGLAEGSRDPGLALALTVHAVLVTVPLRAFGTPAQREHYLPPMASGQWFGALSLHQTQGASLTPAVTARPSTSDHDGWVLTGELDLVAGAPHAHHFLVVAAHQDGTRTAFVLDRTTPGLLLRDSAPAAMRTCPWGRLVLDDCPAPADAVLGTPGEASAEVEPLLAALDWVFAAAPWLGIMRALARDTIGASRDRTLFGRPLAHSQSTRFALADLATRTELAQGLLRRTAGLFDAGGRPTLPQAAAARLFVASCARAVTEAAARITGPLTPTGDRLAERAFRDALFFSETGGGPAVLQPVIAAHLLGIG